MRKLNTFLRPVKINVLFLIRKIFKNGRREGVFFFLILKSDKMTLDHA